MGRRPCCEKVGLKRGGWSAPEDEILTNYIKAYGEGNWRDLPRKAGLKRCGKGCRLRWLNYLSPKIIRGNITQEEEDLIIKLHKHHGNRWSLIARHLPARTDNEIKNFWNTVLCRKVNGQHVVAKRKRQIRTNGKKSDSNSVPRRRATVLPTQSRDSTSAAEPSGTHFPALVSAESPDAVVTPQQSATLQESSAEFMPEILQNREDECYTLGQLLSSQVKNTECVEDIIDNIAEIEAPQCQVDAECYTPRQLISSRENHTECMGDIMQNIVNNEAPRCHVNKECYAPQQLASFRDNDTEFVDDLMQNIADIEATWCDVDQECYAPPQSVSFWDNDTEIMDDLMQNVADIEATWGEVDKECSAPQQLVSVHGNGTALMGDLISNIEVPQSELHKKWCTQEPGLSEVDNTELMCEIMQHIINFDFESRQGDVSVKCYSQKHANSSQRGCMDFMGENTQSIVNNKSAESPVYGNFNHDTMFNRATEYVCVPDRDEYSMQTYGEMLSKLTFTQEESIAEYSNQHLIAKVTKTIEELQKLLRELHARD